MLASTIERVEKELGHLWSPKNKVAIEDVKNIRNKVWWRCEKGHDYERTTKNMSTYIRRGYASCPICMNREVLTGFNDLAYKFPELAKEYSSNIGSCEILFLTKFGWGGKMCGLNSSQNLFNACIFAVDDNFGIYLNRHCVSSFS